jgi:hypothetical protein
MNEIQKSILFEESKENILLERSLILVKYLKPKFGKDGNQFFYMLGELPNPDCIVGFGNSPERALINFCLDFYGVK